MDIVIHYLEISAGYFSSEFQFGGIRFVEGEIASFDRDIRRKGLSYKEGSILAELS